MRMYLGVFCTPLVLLIALTSCTKQEASSACKNEFAIEYDLMAETECCCEYDLKEIIDDLVGTYKFSDHCDHFDYNYNTTISRVENDSSSIILRGFNFHNQELIATFNRGQFNIDHSYVLGGCEFQLQASLYKSDRRLLVESKSKILGGLCSNLIEQECIAVSN